MSEICSSFRTEFTLVKASSNFFGFFLLIARSVLWSILRKSVPRLIVVSYPSTKKVTWLTIPFVGIDSPFWFFWGLYFQEGKVFKAALEKDSLYPSPPVELDQRTLAFVIFPSSVKSNCRTTIPSTPSLWAEPGYLGGFFKSAW